MAFDTILIANRGEIACRVIRTARALGYRTVAVFSDADAAAPHVALADCAVRIGPARAAESYLLIPAILDAAKRTGAGAVHPGYGFLSERAAFAQACLDAGLVFIGPPPSAITAMGDKAGAKRRMLAAGVPCAPGYLPPASGEPGAAEGQRDEVFAVEAARIGYPLLVKAVAGGGGRGMRLVREAGELPEALAGARREAESSFGDGTLMLEKLVERGRHVEVQVFADAHGHVIHLGERDCTAQRRRQKVIEEAPSPIIDVAMREAMGRDAVAAARAVGYVGAGTVEFIVARDGSRHGGGAWRHFFLEMNTRLQVEHPVTEMVTGLDLVAWQLRVAAGEPLPLQQTDVQFNGHAIEARLYAEDPAAQFRPQTGRITHWRPAAALRPGVRIDDGIVEGGEVGPHYDAMVAKVIAHGRDRAEALRKLASTIADSPLLGVRNNGRFLRDLCRHPDFAGDQQATGFHTGTLDEWSQAGDPVVTGGPIPDEAWRVAAAALCAGGEPGARPPGVRGFDLHLRAGAGADPASPDARRVLRVTADGADLLVGQGGRDVHDGPGAVGRSDGSDPALRVLAFDPAAHRIRYDAGGVARSAVVVIARDGQAASVELAIGDGSGAAYRFEEPSPLPAVDGGVDPRRARAQVAGTVAQVKVSPGQRVSAGQPLVCVEAMKMELWSAAAVDGTVAAVHVRAGDQVAAGALLVELHIPA